MLWKGFLALISKSCHPERSANACEHAVKDPHKVSVCVAVSGLAHVLVESCIIGVLHCVLTCVRTSFD